MVDWGAVEVDARVDDWIWPFWDMEKRAPGGIDLCRVVWDVEGRSDFLWIAKGYFDLP